jgi:hypothetical protein
MKRLSIAITILLALSATAARAQTQAQKSNAATAAKTDQHSSFSLGDLKPTTDMWFYEQAKEQYDNPKVAVRKAAEFRAEQRQRRLETMHWFGLSNARPYASSDPIHTDYSPGWASNNYYAPYRWVGAGDNAVMAVHSEPSAYSR